MTSRELWREGHEPSGHSARLAGRCPPPAWLGLGPGRGTPLPLQRPGTSPSCRTQGPCAEMQVYHLRTLGTSSSRQLSLKTALRVTPAGCKGPSVLSAMCTAGGCAVLATCPRSRSADRSRSVGGRRAWEGPRTRRPAEMCPPWWLQDGDVLPRASDHIHHPTSGPLDLTSPKMHLLSQPSPLPGLSVWVLPLRGSDTPAFPGSGT